MEQKEIDAGEFEFTSFLLSFLAALLIALSFDISVYRGHGYAGWGLFLGLSLVSVFVGTLKANSLRISWGIACLILLLVLRIVWWGTDFQCWVGVILLSFLAMSRHGLVPYLSKLWLFWIQSFIAVLATMLEFTSSRSKLRVDQLPIVGKGTLLAYGLPAFIVCVFSWIFVAANPDLAKGFLQVINSIEAVINQFFAKIDGLELIVMFGVFCLAWGQLSPVLVKLIPVVPSQQRAEESAENTEHPLYLPYRNTLIAVIGLFAVYLIFEFRTLWFREFPTGFYYAGYAHQGAAWLTIALALATLILSVIFQREILQDPRVAKLKQLAWWWSAANFLLTLAVYNRMWIYIDFNGMTRMRVVGLYGITTVVVGFMLVVSKIRWEQSFFWLIHRQLWVFCLSIYCLTVTPVDYLIHTYNVRQILSGHLAPTVQITEHPVSLPGWLALFPLLDCEDEIIRDGIQRALVAQLNELERGQHRKSRIQQHAQHWSSFQIAKKQFRAKASRAKLDANQNASDMTKWLLFRDYAYQWY